jgi:hypothetical protein
MPEKIRGLANLINNIEELPLSGSDLISISKSLNMLTSKFMIYEQLHKINSLDQIFGSHFTACYLLFQIRGDNQPIGHWTCLIYHRDKNIYYFYDPYALSIDELLELTHEHDHLKKLLSGRNFIVNKHRHQLMRDDVNTCGRHCVLRSIFWHLKGDEYHRHVIEPCIKNHMVRDPDVLVSLITGLISKTDEPLITFFNKYENDKDN